MGPLFWINNMDRDKLRVGAGAGGLMSGDYVDRDAQFEE